MILQAVLASVVGGFFASFVMWKRRSAPAPTAAPQSDALAAHLVFGASLEAARRVVVGISGG